VPTEREALLRSTLARSVDERVLWLEQMDGHCYGLGNAAEAGAGSTGRREARLDRHGPGGVTPSTG
jgi:hypothetical protein